MEQELYMFYELNDKGELILNDNSKPIIKSKPETKSLDDIRLVVNHNPNNESVINRFIEMYDLGLQWDWFTNHQDWLQDKLEFEEYVLTLPTKDEDGKPIELPVFNKPEPIRPTSKTVDEYRDELIINGMTLREYIFNLVRSIQVRSITVEVDGLIFDGDENSQRRMLSAINAAETLKLDKTPWRLSDNSVVEVTKDQLVQAHAKAILVQGTLWMPN